MRRAFRPCRAPRRVPASRTACGALAHCYRRRPRCHGASSTPFETRGHTRARATVGRGSIQRCEDFLGDDVRRSRTTRRPGHGVARGRAEAQADRYRRHAVQRCSVSLRDDLDFLSGSTALTGAYKTPRLRRTCDSGRTTHSRSRAISSVFVVFRLCARGAM